MSACTTWVAVESFAPPAHDAIIAVTPTLTTAESFVRQTEPMAIGGESRDIRQLASPLCSASIWAMVARSASVSLSDD